jgi:deoxyribonuclease V
LQFEWLQERLRGQVVTEDRLGEVQRVAGVDAHYSVDSVWAAVAVMTFPDLALVESALIHRPLAFPYVPGGLLSFREAPPILEVLRSLSKKPDLLLVDGHGLAHPRRFGLACHLGVLGNVPTIGVAKSHLVGTYQEPGIERGAWSKLVDKGETVGAVVRTRSAVRPAFVSIGHRISLKTQLTSRYAVRATSGCPSHSVRPTLSHASTGSDEQPPSTLAAGVVGPRGETEVKIVPLTAKTVVRVP